MRGVREGVLGGLRKVVQGIENRGVIIIFEICE